VAAEFTERRIQSNGNTVNFNIDRSQPYVDVQKNGQTQRIYGTQEQLDRYQNKKPDGTAALPGSIKTKVNTGKALVKDAKTKITEAVPLVDDFADFNSALPEDFSIDALVENLDNLSRKKQLGNSPSKFPNPLEQFASMVPLWTLAVLTPKQFNKPSEYRTDDLSFAEQTDPRRVAAGKDDQNIETVIDLESSIIFSSAGRADNTRAKVFGVASPEYYIDNFKMMSVVAPTPATGNTNAISFEFDVMEPYSMGLLLQSMQSASLKAGYPDYLMAPFLLRLDFKGYDERGRIIKSLKPKHFVLKFKKVEFNVSEGGSQYSVQAYPYNHQGFADTVDMLWQDISIAPEPDKEATVYSILGDPDNPKSLVRTLNDNEQKLVNQGKYKIKDQYEIQFPERTYDFKGILPTKKEDNVSFDPYGDPVKQSVGGKGAAGQGFVDAGKNPIGESTFDYSPKKGGNFAFRKEDDVVNEETGRIERGKLTINPKERVFNFSQKMKLSDIITQTILSSEQSARAVNGELPLTAEGYVNWFRIDVQIEFLDYDDSIGDYAKKYTYRVVPYLAHASVFGNSTAKPPGQKELKKQIVKEYNYIYTGQNADIIDFDIKINNLFYTGINPAVEGNTQSQSDNDGGGTGTDKTKDVSATTGTDKKAQVANLGKTKAKKDPDMFNVLKGGSGTQSVEQRVAENFHNALIKNASADLIKVDLKILGDTFWLVESGLSNYFVQAAPASQYMADGTCNYEGNDVFIRINFRTPIDVNGAAGTGDKPDGLYSFSKATTLSPFSGIYRVFKLENEFSGGLFTQVLSCVRMQGQEEDFDGDAVKEEAGTNALASKIGPEKENKTNVSQELPMSNKLAEIFGLESIKELQEKYPAGPADKPKVPEGPVITERRRQSNGTLVNFNIDRTKPFTDTTDADGNILRIYEN